MRARLYVDAGRFLEAGEGFLRSDPFSTSVIAVVAGRFAAAEPASSDNLWATLEDGGGRVIGTAMHTPPHNLFVSRMPPEATDALATAIADTGRELPGVNGAVASTAAFAKAWADRTGQASTVITAMRMYRLGDLARPQAVPGGAVLATPDDVELVAGWFEAFHADAQPHAPVEDWPAFAEGRVTAGDVHLWRDGGNPVALAAVGAPAAGVARVGPVYTRRHGGGAATAPP